jgi:anion-transporting  ArsA/GET3 family ATPase
VSVLDDLIDERAVLVCCGSGGVGKTTTAAALAVAAALRGRRACVVTIDPARRLADALGASGVGNAPHEIAGPWPGELHVVMLDATTTFDELELPYLFTAEVGAAELGRLVSELAAGIAALP